MLGRVFVVFACGFLLAESMIYKKRQQEGCERLVECSRPLEDFFVQQDEQPTLLGVSDEQDLDSFCQIKVQQDQCFEDARDGCEYETVVSQVDSTIAMSNYLCSDRGRQVIQALGDSECATDDRKQLELSEAIQSCLETFEFEVTMLAVAAINEHEDLDPDELCPFAKSWIECTVVAAESKCGNAYSNFISDVLDITAGPKFAEFGCENTDNDKRQLIGRSAELWIKRGVLLRRGFPIKRKTVRKAVI